MRNSSTLAYLPLMYEQEDTVVKLSSRMPPQFVGRVEMKRPATLVIKSVIFEDSTYYRCQLVPKVGVVNESYVLLAVTGMANKQCLVQCT